MNIVKLNMIQYFKTIIYLQRILQEGEQSEVVAADFISFDYYKRSINSFIIAFDKIGSEFVDIPEALLYNVTDLNRLRNTYIPSDDVLFTEESGDICA